MASLVFRYLDSVGNGSGTKDMATAADSYFLTAPATREIFVARSLWHITDTGAPTAALFGAATALANGCLLTVVNEDGVKQEDLTDGVAIKSNGDLGRVCYDVTYSGFGAGAQSITARWSFDKAGKPLRLREGWSLKLETQDTIPTDTMYVQAQGYYA